MPDPRSLFDLTGRRALITGAGQGLGFAIARGLAAAGAHVWLNGRAPEPLEEKVESLTSDGLSAVAAPFDVADHGAAEAWFAGLGDAPDILVNNAALRHRRPTEQLAPRDLDRLLAVNTTSAYALTRLALPGMMRAGRGAVLNITSIAGPRARAGDAGYTAAKGGLEALTRSHAVEFGGRGIRVNAIAPGFFATEANADWTDNPDVAAFLKDRSPLARWARPEEIVGAAVFLCSDAASYVNGHVLVVDGGMSIKM